MVCIGTCLFLFTYLLFLFLTLLESCVCMPLLVFVGVCALGGVCVVSNILLLLLLLLLFICQIRACSSAGVSSVIILFTPLSLSVMTCFVLLQVVFEVMGVIAVITNCALVGLAAKSADWLPDMTPVQAVLLFVIIEVN